MTDEIGIPEHHPKGWGEEQWIANNPKYCGKKLILKQGKHGSIHYHKLKDETFYIQSGVVRFELYDREYPGQPTTIVMKAGDSVHVPALIPHHFIGVEDSEIFEFSTQHFEDDTYRIAPGDSQK